MLKEFIDKKILEASEHVTIPEEEQMLNGVCEDPTHEVCYTLKEWNELFHIKLTKKQMIERINALEEELWLSLCRQYNEEHKASEEASRLKMLILMELELI